MIAARPSPRREKMPVSHGRSPDAAGAMGMGGVIGVGDVGDVGAASWAASVSGSKASSAGALSDSSQASSYSVRANTLPRPDPGMRCTGMPRSAAQRMTVDRSRPKYEPMDFQPSRRIAKFGAPPERQAFGLVEITRLTS